MNNNAKSTYRGAIQDLARQTWALYERASPLRDHATLEEKAYWNAYRNKMYEAALFLERLDNSMPDHVANRLL